MFHGKVTMDIGELTERQLGLNIKKILKDKSTKMKISITKNSKDKSQKVQKYWDKTHSRIDYSQIDQSIIKKFKGTGFKYIRIIKDYYHYFNFLKKQIKSHRGYTIGGIQWQLHYKM